MTIEKTIEWHKVIRRKPTENEIEEYKEACDFVPPYILDCTMPEDNTKILVQTPYGIGTDTCMYDDGYYLDNRDNWDDVIAWAYLPKGIEVE